MYKEKSRNTIHFFKKNNECLFRISRLEYDEEKIIDWLNLELCKGK